MYEKKQFNEMTEAERFNYVLKTVGRAAFGLFVFVTMWSSFEIVGAGDRGVVLRLGAVNRVMNEGFNLKMPFIENVKTLDVKTQKETATASAASKDLQTVTAEIALNYHLSPDSVGKLWQSVGKDYKERIVDPAIQESLKAATAKFTAEELITKREEVKNVMKENIAKRLAVEFIAVDEVSIVNFEFSNSFNDAIEAKVTAEQNALAAKNKLEQVKFEAEQRVTSAKAEAEAIRIQAQAITQQGGAEYVNLKAVEKWNGILPVYTLGGSIPFINIDKD